MNEDDQLMIRLQGGDSSAFDELVQKYQSALVGYFYNHTRDIQLSEDLTQETLLRVYSQSWDYLPSGRFKGWMFRIGHNLWIDDFRRRTNDALVKAIKGNSGDGNDYIARIASGLISPDQQVDRQEVNQEIQRVLTQIPEDQRSTILLHYFNGLTLEEVGDVMECSVSTAKSRLRLARQKLKDLLKQYDLTSSDY